jgi:hypothetical protein
MAATMKLAAVNTKKMPEGDSHPSSDNCKMIPTMTAIMTIE